MLNVEQKYYYTHAHARATTKYGAVRGNLLRISAPQKVTLYRHILRAFCGDGLLRTPFLKNF